MRRNIDHSKESYPCIAQDSPFLSFAIWLARVIHEAGQIATWSGIDHPIVVQRQKIIGFILGVLFGFQAALEFIVVDNLSHVFNDIVTFLYVNLRFKTPTFTAGVKRV